MNAIELKNLSKTYQRGADKVRALSNINLRVPVGEFTTLVGPSGCGKSTLLQLVGAMDSPTEGEVLVSGNNLASLNEKQLSAFRRQEVGFVFQFFHLLPNLSVEENVALPLLLDGITTGKVQDMVTDALESSKIIQRRKHLPQELSGGEMQRTAIARAIVHKPRVLIADEPTGNLDSSTSEAIIDLLKHCNKKLKMTVLVATHSSKLAETGSKQIRLQDGQLCDS